MLPHEHFSINITLIGRWEAGRVREDGTDRKVVKRCWNELEREVQEGGRENESKWVGVAESGHGKRRQGHDVWGSLGSHSIISPAVRRRRCPGLEFIQ